MKRYNALLEPRLLRPEDAVLGDGFNAKTNLHPAIDFVVSRTKDGEVLSYYGDDVWDLSPYRNIFSRPCKLNFLTWCNKLPEVSQGGFSPHIRSIITSMKWLLFLVMYKYQSRKGAHSVGGISGYLSLLTSIARVAFIHGVTPIDVLQNSKLLKVYVASISNRQVIRLATLLKALQSLGEREVGFIVLSGRSLDDLKRLVSQTVANAKQTAVIPPRIYSELIQLLLAQLDAFETVWPQLKKLTQHIVDDDCYARSAKAQDNHRRRTKTCQARTSYQPIFIDALRDHQLEAYAKQNNWNTIVSIIRELKKIQTFCKCIIHFFSGMRDSEAAHLPYHCLSVSRTSSGRTYYRLHGVTSKLHGEAQRTQWVTSREGERAVRIAQEIALCIYSALNVTLPMTVSDKFPLFVSVCHFPFSPNKLEKKHNGHFNVSEFRSGCRTHIDELSLAHNLIITEADIQELEKIDPWRGWRQEDEFIIGKPWRLTSHQCRRSLAIYTAQSGLVSLPTLRRQLQHITEEMTLYYAKGSTSATNLIGNNTEHFGQHYQDVQPDSEALSYIYNVLFSKEPLFGGHGKWLDKKKVTGTTVLDDRERTIKAFRQGQIAYKDTMLGGCLTMEPCHKKAMRSITACLDCGKAVIKQSKLKKVITAQKICLSTLDQNTVEWRTEQQCLSDLENYHNLITKVKVKENEYA